MEMKILFLLNFIISLGIFIFLSVKSFLFYKTKDYHKISFYFFVIGLLYLFLSLFSFVWFFGFLNYSPEDFLFLYSFLIVFQSLLFFRIIYFMSLHKKLLYLLMFYLIGVGSMLYSFSTFANFIIIISFLLMFLFFMDLIFRDDNYQALGYFGMFYSILGLSFETLLIFQIGNVYLLNLLLNLVFCFFIFIFIKDLQKIPLVSKEDLNKGPRPPFLVILGHLFFIIIFVNFIFIGTIGIHEFGHFSISKFYNCDYRKIVYEDDFFRTEVLCDGKIDNSLVLLGGILAPFLLAILLFFIGGKFMKEMAFLLSGFNFLAIAKDLQDFGLSQNLIFAVLLLGGSFLIYGIIIISKLRIEDEVYLPGFN
ncbi:MAG TPA: hypothetical protein HA283_05755 [Nanoarchaeota archaeon]|nr:hypothetical protein [Nanoarchaeota archaeon]HIJ09647.1 hypothetical protein [Nanoarchaeota archaeon]